MPPLIPRLPGLPRPRLPVVDTHRLAMPDGVVLATDVHRPAGAGRWPTVLIRTPYGRRGLTGAPLAAQAQLLVASGYAVVLQDVRGRFDSGGAFVPMVAEGADGARTVDWVHDQPWCDGHVACWGLSYLAATAWAAAACAPDRVDALAVGIGHSRLGLPDPQGVRHLETTMRWLRSLEVMADADAGLVRRARGLLDARLADPDLPRRLAHLPLVELDEAVLGHRSPAWRAWVDHPDVTDPFWAPGDHRPRVAGAPPTAHTTGWWDVFADSQLADHAAQVAAGRPGPLLVGPWTHLDPRVQVASFRQARRHFDTHLRGADPTPPLARVWLGGAERWWTMPSWPPPGRTVELLLSAHALVDADAATSGGPLRIRYDPADPTPSLGGRTLSTAAGRVDIAPLARRGDVAVLTSRPLDRPATLVGSAGLHAIASADTGTADVVAVLADVAPDGRATSVTDGAARVRDAAGGAPVDVILHPVAHRFAPGHRIRLLVAGGAFPRLDRNLGVDGDWLHATAPRPTTMVLERGASLFLPVLR